MHGLRAQDLDEGTRRPAGARGVREIRLEAISGTVEPNRAADFDSEFRPAGATRCRWQRVWLAFRDGVALPPISVVQMGDAYAIRDGHHRVSVAKALGAPTIHAIVACQPRSELGAGSVRAPSLRTRPSPARSPSSSRGCRTPPRTTCANASACGGRLCDGGRARVPGRQPDR